MAYELANDSVVESTDLPRPTAGAAEPVLIANEHSVQIAYYVYAADDIVALAAFTQVDAHYFGPPHDEAVARHPLHSRGLEVYGAFEVQGSSWIRQLRELAGSRIDGRHFILTFHDITFECIAHRVTVSMHREHPAVVIRDANTQKA